MVNSTIIQASRIFYDGDILWFWDSQQNGWIRLSVAAGYATTADLTAGLATKLSLAGGAISGNLGISGTLGLAGAVADSTNKLALKALAALFYNDAGTFQHKISKNADADTASVLFQKAFSGRAEFGLVGDNDFRLKVSPDGSTWLDGVVFNRTTGVPTFSQGIAGGGRLKSFQWFIANGTWTKPAGVRFCLVFCLGGGAGGGGAQGGTSAGACGAGGGAGGMSVKFIDVSAIATVTVTIGAAGAAGANTGGTGGTGGTSSFGAHCSADGGVGGTGQASGTFAQIVSAGYGGNATGGDFNFTGGAGSPGIRLDASNGIAGKGASVALFGGGGNGYAGNATGQAGITRGDGGGGGVVTNNATGQAGGAGSTGIIWVWEFE